MTDDAISGLPRRDYFDRATADHWAADSGTSEIIFARLFEHWPEVHHLLAANPATPVYILERLAFDSRPDIRTALLANDTARRVSIHPIGTMLATGEITEPRAACSICGASVTRASSSCPQCHTLLTFSATTTPPARSETPPPPAPQPPSAPPEPHLASIPVPMAATAIASVPVVAPYPAHNDPIVARALAEARARTEAMPLVTASPATARPAKAAGSGQAGAGFDGTYVARRARFGLGTLGPLGIMAFCAAVALIALVAIVANALAGSSVKQAKSSIDADPGPRTNATIPAATRASVAAAATSPETQAATNQSAPLATTPAEVPAEVPAKVPAEVPTTLPPTTQAPTTRQATTTTRPPAAAATTALQRIGPSVETVQAVATLAQRYASALASKNADTVKRLNPAHSGDLSGYKYLDASTVLPVSVALVQGDSYRLKHGLIANESRPEGTRTVLYCASWTVNLAAGTVSPGTGRTIRTVVGYVGVGAVSAELQRECA